MDNPRAALPGWCSASGRLSRTGPLKRSARRLSDVGLGTSGIGAERSWEYRFNPCENRLTPRQNAQQIPDEREVGTRPSFHHVSVRVSAWRSGAAKAASSGWPVTGWASWISGGVKAGFGATRTWLSGGQWAP